MALWPLLVQRVQWKRFGREGESRSPGHLLQLNEAKIPHLLHGTPVPPQYHQRSSLIYLGSARDRVRPSMTIVEQYTLKVQQQQAAVEAERRRRWAEVTSLWEQCCQAEGADPGTAGISFTPENPYLALYERAVASYMR
jgi:hypothetical protein